MFVKGAVTGQLTRTAGPWSSILKSQPPPLQHLWSAEIGADHPELAGDLGSSNLSVSEETNPNLSPPPTLQHFCGSIGHLFTWHLE